MILYVYSKNTKEYIGEVEANLDPLESALQGREIFVIPPYCTMVPPLFEEGKASVYNEEKREWDLIEDNRGTVVYNKKTKEALLIDFLGEIPSDYSINKPFDLQEYKEEVTTDLKVAYSNAQQALIKVGKVEVGLDDRFDLAKVLDFLSEAHPIYYFDMKDKSVELNKDEIKKILDKLYERSMFLPEKRNEILKEIRGAKSKKALDTIREEIKEFK